jgi:hypothetical protein
VTWLALPLWLATIGLAVFNALFGFAFPGIFEAVGTDAAAGHALFITVSLVSVGYATAGWLILRQRPRPRCLFGTLGGGRCAASPASGFCTRLRRP